MRAILLFVFLAILAGSKLQAQARFSVEDTLQVINGSTSRGVLHDLIQAHNHTGDTLHMRWRKKVTGNPPAWKVNFADPQQNHLDISNIDSAGFVLPDSTNWTYNKFVIGIDPLGMPGQGTWIFTVFEEDYPADSIRLYYHVTVYSDMSLSESSAQTGVCPNPSSDKVYIDIPEAPEEEVLLIDAQGRRHRVRMGRDAQARFLDVSLLAPGAYQLLLRQGNQYFVEKLVIR